MIGARIVLALACLGVQPVQAADVQASPQPNQAEPAPSLMFTPAEVAAIRRALSHIPLNPVSSVQAGAGSGPPAVRTQSNIFVSGVGDSGDGQWTVWANGYRISPDHQAPDFTVVSVRDETVEIVVTGQQPAHFRLHPHQTWRAEHHDIIEGIFP